METCKQVLLVLGAAGGVGSAAVQIGKLLGAVVIAAARYTCFFHDRKTFSGDLFMNYNKRFLIDNLQENLSYLQPIDKHTSAIL